MGFDDSLTVGRRVVIVTDKAALKEIARQERRFAAADCGRGRLLAKSSREHYDTISRVIARPLPRAERD